MIRFELKLPSLPPIPPMPNLGRHILITVLVASLIMSGTSMYVTLAAPQRAIYVPDTVGFEGQLADSQGVPVADGEYTITFTLYDAATGGTNVWSETQQSVEVKDGLYSVQLGSVTDLAADDFNDDRWLGIKVGSDAEMTPRIQVGAVPFALNAQHAMGLQGNDVSAAAPQDKNALLWDDTADKWEPRGLTFPDLAPVDSSNASPSDLLANYRSGAILRWKDANTVEVSTGELMIDGYMRRNTSTVDVKFAGDAGGNGPNRGLASSPTPNTTYYIYAIADDAESTFDLLISENATTPPGVTNFRKLGSFKTESSNTNIIEGSAANSIEMMPQYVPNVRVYNSSNISVPASTWKTIPLNSERWDNDNIHNTTSDNTRLTTQTTGKYLIFGSVNIASNAAEKLVLGIKVNGQTYIGITTTNTYGLSNPFYLNVTTAYQLSAGDYVELYVRSDAATTVSATGNYSPEFGMVWLGP